ncbi:late endosomal/lysosomal adaptor, MAPK and MTOR activator 1 [Rhodnius prolixus]|uniref:Ragulator complex protein LAMTOR1 n=1 Tax=Rhodnius prolixus TaxID=13249 RepID=R4G8C9_RHOPR
MGCCLSCCGETKSQNGDADERTRLISDPVINSSDGQRIPSETVVSPYQQSLPSKSDEQSMLNKILQQTAINVIDISTLGPHMMEQNEYLERRSAYISKVDSVNHFLPVSKPIYTLMEDVPFPETLFSEPPVTACEYSFIKLSASKVKSALSSVKVTHTEDLVVPFHIPQKRVVSPSVLPNNTHLPQSCEMPAEQT